MSVLRGSGASRPCDFYVPMWTSPALYLGAEIDVLALDEALTRLAQLHPEKAELVKLRFFAGLTLNEAAGVLDVSPATADRYWAFARAWLFREMGGR